jgi:uncharacterized protein
MDLIIIALAAFLASMFTLFSGFGLGMLLMAAMSLFYPVELAIGLTAIVHFLNNIFKFILFKNHINFKILFYFGGAAFIFSYIGAELLSYLKDLHIAPLENSYLNVFVAIILVVFAFYKPKIDLRTINPKFLGLGGILSGFFGGFAGQQGAIRSAFLVNLGLTKHAFIATGVAIALFIDIIRISIYYKNNILNSVVDEQMTVFIAIMSAFIGIFLGKKIFDKTEVKWIHFIVKGLIVLVAIFLILGIKLK